MRIRTIKREREIERLREHWRVEDLREQWAEEDRLAEIAVGNQSKPKKNNKKKSKKTSEPKVIERQVLVTRCKFCKHITPVDLETCDSCGAAKFS